MYTASSIQKVPGRYVREINPPLVKNTGNIFQEDCKSGKQTSVHARVCLQDLQYSREIFLLFWQKVD